jgi:hypothetical protein
MNGPLPPGIPQLLWQVREQRCTERYRELDGKRDSLYAFADKIASADVDPVELERYLPPVSDRVTAHLLAGRLDGRHYNGRQAGGT